MRSPQNPADAILAIAYARRLDDPHDPLSCEVVPAFRLLAGDAVLCVAGDEVPAPGVVLDGRADVCRPETPDAALGTAIGHHVVAGARLIRGWIVLRLLEAPP